MSLRDTLQQITALQRMIVDQQRLIDDFLKQNRDQIQMVTTEIDGSSKSYDKRMLTELSQTEAALKNSIGALDRASAALDRVRSI